MPYFGCMKKQDLVDLLASTQMQWHIYYSNCFMRKCNSCSWQPEHRTISRYIHKSTIVFKEIAYEHHDECLKIMVFPYIEFCIIGVISHDLYVQSRAL